MRTIIGIDVGGSTTKIVAAKNNTLLNPILVSANDPITSIYGAFGKFTNENALELSDVDKVVITGVGASYVDKPIYGLKCESVSEFECFGRGGLYLSGLDEAIVVSMGTGTANVYSKKNGDTITNEYLGGTGVGGGTMIGLSKKMLNMDNVEHILELAEEGNLDNVDLKVKDIYKHVKDNSLPQNLTASNFGKLSDVATDSDVALAIINMIFETTAMLAVFASRMKNTKNVVLTGNLSNFKLAKTIFSELGKLFDTNFIIPENSQFATAIGAALL
ncbi:MAG: type II pantothenate kinase [Clostridiales bacterium]|nr:type II pantothenate kinase [Clostridiales bacterium]